MAFTSIPNSDIDPGSPITTGLMTAFRDNDDFLLAQTKGLVLVEKKIITSDVSSVTFSSLDGDTDEVYRIIGKILAPATGARDLELRPNGVTTAQIGVSHGARSNGVVDVDALTRLVLIKLYGNIAHEASFDAIFWARKTVNSVAQDRVFQSTFQARNTGNRLVGVVSGEWNEQATNVTSLVVSTSSGNILNGSTIALYKMRQS